MTRRGASEGYGEASIKKRELGGFAPRRNVIEKVVRRGAKKNWADVEVENRIWPSVKGVEGSRYATKPKKGQRTGGSC